MMLGRNNVLHKVGLIAVFFILFFSFFSIVLNVEICRAKDGNTLYVGGTGIGNYTTIQDAIDNSSDDDTVFVFNGTYNETIVINKSINLVGFDKNSTFIKGNRSLYIILIKSSWVGITGFTIQDGKAGIYISGPDYSFNNITANIISNNWEGIRLYNSSNNEITQNIYKDHYFGIVLYESKNNHITLNNFTNNTKAIYLSRWSDNNDIYNNNFIGYNLGIILDYSFNNMIYENSITNGTKGVFLSYSHNNNITNNTIEFNDECGIYLSNSDDNVISPNTFFNNPQDVKERPKLPEIKAPGFEILFMICAILFVLFLRKKILKF